MECLYLRVCKGNDEIRVSIIMSRIFRSTHVKATDKECNGLPTIKKVNKQYAEEDDTMAGLDFPRRQPASD